MALPVTLLLPLSLNVVFVELCREEDRSKTSIGLLCLPLTLDLVLPTVGLPAFCPTKATPDSVTPLILGKCQQPRHTNCAYYISATAGQEAWILCPIFWLSISQCYWRRFLFLLFKLIFIGAPDWQIRKWAGQCTLFVLGHTKELWGLFYPFHVLQEGMKKEDVEVKMHCWNLNGWDSTRVWPNKTTTPSYTKGSSIVLLQWLFLFHYNRLQTELWKHSRGLLLSSPSFKKEMFWGSWERAVFN